MYFKLALNNIKKSFKDYGIYFLTLTLAVCIFYSFNSIESQKAMIDVSMSDPTYMENFMMLISSISVFVAVILGGLILYANNFLIKRRNKELGIYMILGMPKNKISVILILETFIVGTFSLISGLILGFITSQGLSVLVSKIFDFKMSGYTFTISISAMKKTVLCFGIIFIIIMLFNSFVISKYKIIDLLMSRRKNEELKFKNQFVYLIGFILCGISLSIAYKLILDNGLGENNVKLIIALILGVIGTVLFFFSLSGFILFIVRKNKNIYFKGLNIFTLNQINSKINTNFISMSVISIMLCVTITVLTTGFTFKESLDAENKQFTPFDATITSYTSPDIKEILQFVGVKFNDNDKLVYYNEYVNENQISDIIIPGSDVKYDDSKIIYMKISNYNKIRELRNQDTVNLKDNEVLVISNSPNLAPLIQEYIDNNKDIKIEGEIYNIKNKKVIQDSLKTGSVYNPLTVIVNDSFCDNKTLFSTNVNINFGGNNIKEREANLRNIIQSNNNSEGYDKTGYVYVDTKTQIYQNSTSVTSKALFVGIYVGLVFLISSIAVLALQQLSEASDSIDRYISLKRLGVSKTSINKTIFKQILVYFSIPVTLALVHSIVWIKVANEFMLMRNKPTVGYAPLVTATIFIIIYVMYFYITYSGYKNIVENNTK